MQINLLVGRQGRQLLRSVLAWLNYCRNRAHPAALGRALGLRIGVVLLPDLCAGFKAG